MRVEKYGFIKILILFIVLCPLVPLNASDLRAFIYTSTPIRHIPDTMYGTNMHCWDSAQNGGNDTFDALMAASGRRYVRWPGGSWGDAYLWSDMEGPYYSNTGIVSYDESMFLLNKNDKIMQPIVNFPGYWYYYEYGTASAISAAVAWVQDQSSRIPSARYWEIGNETGGDWEAGWFPGINGTYYGDIYADFYNAMKAVNPQIKIGADADPCDVHQPWYTYDGLWTRDTLNAAYAKGIVPDFLIVHQYPALDMGSVYNPTLLSTDIDKITSYTTSMNNIIATSIGPQYVGKIKYWMTEWDSGFQNSTYNRPTCYVNALFHAQYILEMAKNGWEGSNEWSQWEYDSSFTVYPVWYITPMLKSRFGRDMVSTLSTDARVRVYASRDEANNLTIFMANNHQYADRVVRISISDFNVATTGEKWVISPYGTIVPGGQSIQDYNDININGIIHPNPLTLSSISGIPVSTSNLFEITVPMSSMLLLKIPPAVQTEQLPYGSSNPWPIPGTIEAEDYDTGGQFVAYYDTNAGNDGGQYRSDDVDIETCSEGGYDVNGIYPGEWLEYTVDVNSSGIYKIEARVASADANGVFRIEFDGQDITGPVTFPPTGGAQTFANADINRVFLRKGQHTMRLLMDTNGWSINWISFSKVGGGTGKSLREWWTNISGSAVSNLTSNVNYPNNPTGKEFAHSFEGPTNWADSYGTRIRGYLHPIASGNYTFWIASDDASELWLSTDTDPNHKTRIARVPSATYAYQWDAYTEQQSAVIPLVAGQDYYIEVLHKEGSGGDSVAVAWEGPGIIRQAVTGPYLSPYPSIINFTDFSDFSSQWLFTNCKWSNSWCGGTDIDRNGSVTIDDLMQFAMDWLLYGYGE